MSGADKDWIARRQPRPGARTLWEHPLARGLVDQWNLADTSLASATRLHGASVVGNITRSNSIAGMGWAGAYQSSGNYLSVPRTSAFSYTTQLSFECMVVMKSFQTTTFPYISGLLSQYQSTSGGTNHFGPYLRFNPDATVGNAAVPVFCVTQSSGTERQITGAACSVGVPIHLLGTYDGVNLCLYVNGVRTSAARTGAFDNNASNFISLLSDYVVNSSTLTHNRCADGTLLFARVWNVGKTAEEAAELYRNPWALWDSDDLATFARPSSGVTSASIAAVDGADVQAIATTVTTGAAIAATDGADVQAIVAAVWTTADLAATDGADLTAIAATVTTGADIAVTDGADVTSITASIGGTTSASIDTVDGGDLTAILAGVTIGRPIADIATDGWAPSTGSDLWPMLDEAVQDDGDYIFLANPTAAEEFEVKLGPMIDPASSSGHVISLGLRAVDEDTVFDLYLVQGASVLDSWQETVTAGAAVTRTHTLSAIVADSITDYADLRIRGAAHG